MSMMIILITNHQISMNEISIDLKENEENHLNELALIYKVKCCILNNKDSFIYQGEEIVIGSDENRKYINLINGVRENNGW